MATTSLMKYSTLPDIPVSTIAAPRIKSFLSPNFLGSIGSFGDDTEEDNNNLASNLGYSQPLNNGGQDTPLPRRQPTPQNDLATQLGYGGASPTSGPARTPSQPTQQRGRTRIIPATNMSNVELAGHLKWHLGLDPREFNELNSNQQRKAIQFAVAQHQQDVADHGARYQGWQPGQFAQYATTNAAKLGLSTRQRMANATPNTLEQLGPKYNWMTPEQLANAQRAYFDEAQQRSQPALNIPNVRLQAEQQPRVNVREELSRVQEAANIPASHYSHPAGVKYNDSTWQARSDRAAAMGYSTIEEAEMAGSRLEAIKTQLRQEAAEARRIPRPQGLQNYEAAVNPIDEARIDQEARQQLSQERTQELRNNELRTQFTAGEHQWLLNQSNHLASDSGFSRAVDESIGELIAATGSDVLSGLAKGYGFITGEEPGGEAHTDSNYFQRQALLMRDAITRAETINPKTTTTNLIKWGTDLGIGAGVVAGEVSLLGPVAGMAIPSGIASFGRGNTPAQAVLDTTEGAAMGVLFHTTAELPFMSRMAAIGTGSFQISIVAGHSPEEALKSALTNMFASGIMSPELLGAPKKGLIELTDRPTIAGLNVPDVVREAAIKGYDALNNRTIILDPQTVNVAHETLIDWVSNNREEFLKLPKEQQQAYRNLDRALYEAIPSETKTYFNSNREIINAAERARVLYEMPEEMRQNSQLYLSPREHNLLGSMADLRTKIGDIRAEEAGAYWKLALDTEAATIKSNAILDTHQPVDFSTRIATILDPALRGAIFKTGGTNKPSGSMTLEIDAATSQKDAIDSILFHYENGSNDYHITPEIAEALKATSQTLGDEINTYLTDHAPIDFNFGANANTAGIEGAKLNIVSTRLRADQLSRLEQSSINRANELDKAISKLPEVNQERLDLIKQRDAAQKDATQFAARRQQLLSRVPEWINQLGDQTDLVATKKETIADKLFNNRKAPSSTNILASLVPKGETFDATTGRLKTYRDWIQGDNPLYSQIDADLAYERFKQFNDNPQALNELERAVVAERRNAEQIQHILADEMNAFTNSIRDRVEAEQFVPRRADAPPFVREAQDSLDKQTSQFNSNPVRAMVDTMILTGYDLYKLGVDGLAWTKQMVLHFGEDARPYLLNAYDAMFRNEIDTRLDNRLASWADSETYKQEELGDNGKLNTETSRDGYLEVRDRTLREQVREATQKGIDSFVKKKAGEFQYLSAFHVEDLIKRGLVDINNPDSGQGPFANRLHEVFSRPGMDILSNMSGQQIDNLYRQGMEYYMANNADPFFSSMKQTLAEKLPNTFKVEQLEAILSDPRWKDERTFTIGLNEFINSNRDGRVSKQDLLDVINKGQVRLEVRELTEEGLRATLTPKPYTVKQLEDNFWIVINPSGRELPTRYETQEDAQKFADIDFGDLQEGIYNKTQHGRDNMGTDNLETPGPREDYRENLLVAPNRTIRLGFVESYGDKWIVRDKISSPVFDTKAEAQTWLDKQQTSGINIFGRFERENRYDAPHFGGAYINPDGSFVNQASEVIGHYTSNIRDIYNKTGELIGRALHGEEFQSDKGQSANKQHRINLVKIADNYGINPNDLSEPSNFITRNIGFPAKEGAYAYAVDAGKYTWNDLEKATRNILDKNINGNNPDNTAAKYLQMLDAKGYIGGLERDPFYARNGREIIFKRFLRQAVEQGVDNIAWTIAETQRIRNRKEEGSIAYRGYDTEYVEMANKIGKKFGVKVERQQILTRGMIDVVISNEHVPNKWSVSTKLTDNSTDVMASFDTLEKAKTYAADIVKAQYQEVWSMSIPDSMRQALLKSGQPFYGMLESPLTDIVKGKEIGIRNRVTDPTNASQAEIDIKNALADINSIETQGLITPAFRAIAEEYARNTSTFPKFLDALKSAGFEFKPENEPALKVLWENTGPNGPVYMNFGIPIVPALELGRDAIKLLGRFVTPKNWHGIVEAVNKSIHSDKVGGGLLSEPTSKLPGLGHADPRRLMRGVALAQAYPAVADIYRIMTGDQETLATLETRIQRLQRDGVRGLNKQETTRVGELLIDTQKDNAATPGYGRYTPMELTVAGLNTRQINLYNLTLDSSALGLTIRESQLKAILHTNLAKMPAPNMAAITPTELAQVATRLGEPAKYTAQTLQALGFSPDMIKLYDVSKTTQTITNITNHYRELRDGGYMTMKREGPYAIVATDPTKPIGHPDAVHYDRAGILTREETIRRFQAAGYTNIRTYTTTKDVLRALKDPSNSIAQLHPHELEALITESGVDIASPEVIGLMEASRSRFAATSYQIRRTFFPGFDPSIENIHKSIQRQASVYASNYYAAVTRRLAIDKLNNTDYSHIDPSTLTDVLASRPPGAGPEVSLGDVDPSLHSIMESMILDETAPYTRGGKGWRYARLATSLMMLAYEPGQFYMNAFIQPVQMNYAWIAKHMDQANPLKGSEVIMGKAARLTQQMLQQEGANWFRDKGNRPAILNTKVPADFQDLYRKLAEAKLVAAEYTKDMIGAGEGEKFINSMFVLSRAGERVTRTHMAASAYYIARDTYHLTGNDMYTFVAEAIYATQSRVGRGENPNMFRSEFGKLLYQFNVFNHMWFENLALSARNDIQKITGARGIGSKATAISNTALFRHLGGVMITAGMTGMPLYGLLNVFWAKLSGGRNIEDALEELIGKGIITNALSFGVTGVIQADALGIPAGGIGRGISARASARVPIIDTARLKPNTIAAWNNGSHMAAIMSVIRQQAEDDVNPRNIPAWSLLMKEMDAASQFSGGQYRRAFETAAPRFISTPMKAYRAYEEQGFTQPPTPSRSFSAYLKSRTQGYVKGPSTAQAIMMSLGINDSDLLRHYETRKKEVFQR